MRRLPLRTLVLLLLGGAVTAAAPTPAPVAPEPMNPRAGVLFSRLTPCAESLTLAFVAREPGPLIPDTLCVDPAVGELSWAGGAVRGLGLDAEGGVLAATRFELWRFAEGAWTSLDRWREPLGGRLAGNPRKWPRLRGAPLDSSIVGTRPLTSIEPFPERYVPLANGTLLFLLDAEYPLTRGVRLHDLHARLDDSVEWSVARNLEIRSWVVSTDSLCWALAARAHVPDYGGGTREVVLAGRGEDFQTFRVGTPVAALWDDADLLWVLNRRGQLYRITPRDGAWTVEQLTPPGVPCGCLPAEPESLWVWSLGEAFSDRNAAAAQRQRVERTGDGRSPGGWVVREREGVFRPCWGGALTKEALMEALPEPPFPGAVTARVPARGGDYLGPFARIRMPAESGVATLRNTLNRGRVASELWWRFPGMEREVRLAGPWGLSPSVDTPPSAP